VTDSDSLCSMPAAELAAAIRRRSVSPVEAVDAVLARIERLNPILNAYCTVTADQARAAARQAEAAVMRSASLGPLHGVPVSIKDLILTNGVRTTFGSARFADFVPTEDAPVVERLRRAGAIVLGKTNTPEFGYKGTTVNPLFGATRNPWRLDRTSGGSSGGGAAAVAAGLGPLAVGTDGGGSIRIPASCCGIFGFKPSLGRIPAAPAFGGLEIVTHVGPLARTVEDAALMLNAVAGPDPRDLSSLPAEGVDYTASLTGGAGAQGLRLAWTADWGYAPVDPEVRRVCEAAARRFAEAGARVDEISPGFPSPEGSFLTLFTGLWAARFGADLDEWRERYDPGLVWLVEQGLKHSAVDFIRAAHTRRTLHDAFMKVFAGCDLVLTPTLAAPPLPLGRDYYEEIAGRPVGIAGWTAFTYPLNMTGYPAATVPCGRTPDGLPAGLQIIGPPRADALVLRAAAAFEAIAPWRDAWPAL
jgi:aspartyl-tRNA(Asn)/glutamyl-tRNA(Gln) amidotransferase subunit A